MEKPAATANFRFFFRLLTFFLFLFCANTTSHAKKYASYEYVRSLSFVKADEYFFTASECTYTLDIANVLPENVTIYVNNLPSHVSFVSCKKEVLIPPADSDDENGTHVIMKLSFSKPGSYKINTIDVFVNGIYYGLPSERVEVLENPRNLLPQLSLSFDDEHTIGSRSTVNIIKGEHIRFTLSIKYALQITSLSWTVPENSLFKEVKTYEFADSSVIKKDFTTEEFPLVSLDWQPLLEGTFNFPEISIMALSYSGAVIEMPLPFVLFKVTSADSVEAETYSKERAYAYAFDSRGNTAADEYKKCPPNIVKKIHELRQNEYNSFPFLCKSHDERIVLEQEYGLNNSENEESVPLCMLFLVITLLILILSIVLFILKKIFFAVMSVSVFAVCAVITVVSAVSTFEIHGIFKGGVLSPVPEENVSSGVELKAGTLVFIKQKAASWLYIRHNETYGWIPEDSVYRIE